MRGSAPSPLERARRGLWSIARSLVHGRAQADADRAAAGVGIDARYAVGGAHDAFTHAYVSARLTIAVGEGLAARLGELNELVGSLAAGEPLEAEMDHHNNAVGRGIGRRLAASGDTSRETIARAVRDALDGGRLRVIEAGRLVPTGGRDR